MRGQEAEARSHKSTGVALGLNSAPRGQEARRTCLLPQDWLLSQLCERRNLVDRRQEGRARETAAAPLQGLQGFGKRKEGWKGREG